MKIKPCTLKEANAIVEKWHRHHKPVVGHRFSLKSVSEENEILGVCIVGRPVARALDFEECAEVTRLVTNGYPNACSFLYGAAARVCKAMGFLTIQTYTLEEELGSSLKAAGWVFSHKTVGGHHTRSDGAKRRTDQPETPKNCWKKILNSK